MSGRAVSVEISVDLPDCDTAGILGGGMPSVGTRENPKHSMTRPLTVDLTAEDLFDNVELLRSITLRSPECIKIVALDGRMLQMNPAGLAMIEADDWDSVRHASAFDLIAPEHRDAWIANHERVCAGESLVWEFDVM